MTRRRWFVQWAAWRVVARVLIGRVRQGADHAARTGGA